MFFTQSAAERRSSVPLDRTIKCWGVVERDLDTPWFYVCLRMHEDGFEFGHTLLVADIVQLDALLAQLPNDTSVRSLMVVTPPSMNHSQHWRMERVVRLHTSLVEAAANITFRIEIDCGTTYTLHSLSLASEAPLKPRCIYEEVL